MAEGTYHKLFLDTPLRDKGLDFDLSLHGEGELHLLYDEGSVPTADLPSVLTSDSQETADQLWS